MRICKILLVIIFTFCANYITFAQKIGVIDTNYILSKLPQYKEAEARLNSQIKTWESEIQAMQSEYDTKKAALENERVLLVGEQLKQRENEVANLEKNLKKYISERFGGEGEILKFRANLAKPFQDQIWNAIKTVVEKNNLGMVLDKSNNMNVIFLEKRYDYTDKVLDILLKGSSTKEDSKNKEESKNRDSKTRGKK